MDAYRIHDPEYPAELCLVLVLLKTNGNLYCGTTPVNLSPIGPLFGYYMLARC